VTIFGASLVLAAAYMIVCFALSLVLMSPPFLTVSANPRYQICHPCPQPNAMASFHYLPLIYFFALYHIINNVYHSTASCRGVRPDIFAYMIFLSSEIEW